MPLRSLTPWLGALARRARALRQALPSQCLLCQRWPAQALCDACWQRHAPAVLRCTGCALRQPSPPSSAQAAASATSAVSSAAPTNLRCGQCLIQPPPWQHAHTAVSYEHRWRELIARYKFHADLGLAVPLAARMAQLPALQAVLPQFDALVPIPMTGHALANRGFNAAERLAHHIAPKRVQLHLQRQREPSQPPAAQHHLNREQRFRNMAHAFHAKPNARLNGQRLLLVDDVMTTGATLSAATQALLHAGAAHVDVLVFARTEPN